MKIKILHSIFLLIILSACSPPPAEPVADVAIADLILTGTHIITMDPEMPTVAAVAVAGEKILATGSVAAVMAHRGEATRIIELGERALLPGFIDAHGHMTFVASLIEMIDLASPPVGQVEDINDVVSAISRFIDSNAPPPNTWIFGFGYDDSLLAEGRHPNRDDLDRASTEHPIIVTHVSGHLLAANSLALQMQGIDANTDDPAGGVIRRRSGSREPNGVMEETAMGPFNKDKLAPTEEARFEGLVRQAIGEYASYGVTTIQDGGSSLSDIAMLQAAAASKPFIADVVAFPWVNGFDDEQIETIAADRSYAGGFRVGGVKFGLDGSPQGRTAYLSEPYTEGPPGALPDYRAYPTYPAEKFNPRIATLIERGVPTLVHANGDAAIDMVLEGVAQFAKDRELPDHRTVIIHAQLMRRDQLDTTKALGMLPSYYSAHPFFWGDWHRKSFGEERAAYISPAGDTARMGIPFTIHNDSPIVPPDIMRLIWIAVNRKTRSDFVLGPEQRLTPMQAIHATTLGAAYQYFEEDHKGSLEVGKLADIVVLSADPTTLARAKLLELEVEATYSHGRQVFLKP
jgi:predicted amidohydrolase YtcJ